MSLERITVDLGNQANAALLVLEALATGERPVEHDEIVGAHQSMERLAATLEQLRDIQRAELADTG